MRIFGLKFFVWNLNVGSDIVFGEVCVFHYAVIEIIFLILRNKEVLSIILSLLNLIKMM